MNILYVAIAVIIGICIGAAGIVLLMLGKVESGPRKFGK